MQVHCQRVHHDNFIVLRADNLRHRRSKKLVIGQPGSIGFEVASNAKRLPFLKFFGDQASDVFWLQAQRVAN